MVSVRSAKGIADDYVSSCEEVLASGEAGRGGLVWDVTFVKKIGEGADGEVILGRMAVLDGDGDTPMEFASPRDDSTAATAGALCMLPEMDSAASTSGEALDPDTGGAGGEDVPRVSVALKRIQLDTQEKVNSALVELMVLSVLRNRGVVGLKGWKITRTPRDHRLKAGLPLSSQSLGNGQQMISPDLTGTEVDLRELLAASAAMPRDTEDAKLRSRRRLTAGARPATYGRSFSLPASRAMVGPAVAASPVSPRGGLRAKFDRFRAWKDEKLARLPSFGSSSRASSPGQEDDWSIGRQVGTWHTRSEAGDSHASSYGSSAYEEALPHLDAVGPERPVGSSEPGERRGSGSWLQRKLGRLRPNSGRSDVPSRPSSPLGRLGQRIAAASSFRSSARPRAASSPEGPVATRAAFITDFALLGGDASPPLRRSSDSPSHIGGDMDAAVDAGSARPRRGSLPGRPSSGSLGDDEVSGHGGYVYHCLLALEHCTLGSLHDLPGEAIRSHDRDFVIRGRLLRQLATAVAYLHDEAGIVHLDLKPKNVLLMGGGGRMSVRLADFALARVAPGAMGRSPKARGGGGERGAALRSRLQGVLAPVSDDNEGGDYQFQGTTGYAPPEVLQGDAPTEKADIYAFGLIAYQVATGATPWVGLHHAQVAFKVLSKGERPAWDQLAEDDVPLPVRNLVEQCWHQDPNERPTAAEILSRLAAIARPNARRSDPTDRASARTGRTFGRCQTVGGDYVPGDGRSGSTQEMAQPGYAAAGGARGGAGKYSRSNSLRKESLDGEFDDLLRARTEQQLVPLEQLRTSGPSAGWEPGGQHDLPISMVAAAAAEGATRMASAAGDVAGRLKGMDLGTPAHAGNYSQDNSPVEGASKMVITTT